MEEIGYGRGIRSVMEEAFLHGGEDEGIEIDSNSTKTAKEVGKNCALMKIMAHKSLTLDTLRKNMRMVWKLKGGSKFLR